MMNTSRFLIGLMALLTISPTASQENNGLCACTPGAYRITFNFTSACMENQTTGGIYTSVCFLQGLGNSAVSVSDLIPVVVNSVTVVELGQDLLNVAQQNYSAPFFNGDSFDYVSIVSNNNTVFPKAIQLNVYGQNADGDDIVNIIAVSFTNNCSVYPVIDGYSQGWAVLEELDTPPEGVCTAFDDIRVPTLSPAASPTMSPVAAPVPPTMSPTPVDVPTPPSMAPVDGTPGPTMSPVAAPVSPTIAPTPVDVPKPPSMAPVDGTPGPTMSPVAAPVSPTIVPTPVDVPTQPPMAPVDSTPGPTTAPVTSAPTFSMSMDLGLSMSMGSGEYDSILEDYGIHLPKAKDNTGKGKGKGSKKGKKENGEGGKREKSSKKGASSRKKNSTEDASATTEDTPNETKKEGKKDGTRRRRLRIHRIGD